MSLLSDEKKIYHRIKILSDAFLLSSKPMDYKSVLRMAARHFKVFTEADASVLMLNREGDLVPVCSLGIPFSKIKDVSRPSSTRLKDLITRPIFDVRYTSFMNTPLIHKKKLIGLSAVFSTVPEKFLLFEQEKFEILFLTMLASHITVSIENALQVNLIQLLECSRSEWEKALDTIDDLITIHDADFNIIRANMAVARKFNVDIREIIGKKCYKIFHGTDEPWPTCPHRRSLETMKKCSAEIEDPHMGGIFQITSFPHLDETRTYRGTVNVVKDVTEYRKMMNQIINLNS